MKPRKSIACFVWALILTLQGGAVELEWISQPEDGVKTVQLPSRRPSLSADGRIVAFESQAPLVNSDSDEARDIYVYDRQTRKIERILADEPSRSNGAPSVSETGRFVAFHSYPAELVKGNPPRTSEIYLYDRRFKKIKLITDFDDRVGDGESMYPGIIEGGQHIYFSSNAGNIFSQPRVPLRAAFLFDRYRDRFEIASLSPERTPLNRPVGDVKMTGDGRYVFFKTAATNTVRPLPVNSLSSHLYRWDRKAKVQIRLDEPERGFDETKSILGRYDMDATGEVIVMEVRARDDIKPEATLRNSNLFVLTPATGTAAQITSDIFQNRSHSPSISGDGRFIVFALSDLKEGKKIEDYGGLVVHDRVDNRWEKVVEGQVGNPQISADGSVIAFELEAPEVGAPKPKGIDQIFVVNNPFKAN